MGVIGGWFLYVVWVGVSGFGGLFLSGVLCWVVFVGEVGCGWCFMGGEVLWVCGWVGGFPLLFSSFVGCFGVIGVVFCLFSVRVGVLRLLLLLV